MNHLSGFAAVLAAAAAFVTGCASSAQPPSPPPAASPAGPGKDAPMVSIVENWGVVEGRVEQWQRGSADAPAMLTLAVERVSAVEQSPGVAYPNFVNGREGTTIRVRVPDDAARRLEVAPGQRVRVRVRRGRGADEFFAHPDEITVVR